jgi:serine/threonine-protein kinase
VLGTGTDGRSDVYALGATMYALLTGAVPPPAHERLTGSPLVPPRTVHAAIPAELERLVLWCLELRPEHRPQSIEQVRAALGRCGTEDAQPDPVTDAVTVTMRPALPPTTGWASATRAGTHPPPAAARARLPTWARSATTATALLGLGTAVALLHAWRPGSGHDAGQTRVPEVEPPSTVTTIARVPAPAVAPPVAELPIPTTLPATLETRIRQALGDDEFGAVTIEVTSDRIRLGQLRSEAQAQRARELVAALSGPERSIDTEVQTRPAPPPPPPPTRDSYGTARPPRAPPRRPVDRPRRQASRPPKPAPRSRSIGRPASPPAHWVLIPQPARRTD